MQHRIHARTFSSELRRCLPKTRTCTIRWHHSKRRQLCKESSSWSELRSGSNCSEKLWMRAHHLSCRSNSLYSVISYISDETRNWIGRFCGDHYGRFIAQTFDCHVFKKRLLSGSANIPALRNGRSKWNVARVHMQPMCMSSTEKALRTWLNLRPLFHHTARILPIYLLQWA